MTAKDYAGLPAKNKPKLVVDCPRCGVRLVGMQAFLAHVRKHPKVPPPIQIPDKQ